MQHNYILATAQGLQYDLFVLSVQFQKVHIFPNRVHPAIENTWQFQVWALQRLTVGHPSICSSRGLGVT